MSIPKLNANLTGFSTTTKIGIGVGVVAFVALAAGLYCCCRRCPNFRITLAKEPGSDKTDTIAKVRFITQTLRSGSKEQIEELIENKSIDVNDLSNLMHVLKSTRLLDMKDEIALLFVQKMSDLNQVYNQDPLIVHAAQNACKQTVDWLIDNGADTSGVNNSSIPLILCVIKNGWLDTLEKLPNELYNINVRNPSLHAKNPLHAAIGYQKVKIALYLLDHVAINDEQYSEVNLLELAATNRQEKVVAKLIEKGANPDTDVKENDESMPFIHFVIKHRWLEVLKLLPKELYTKAHNGKPPLETALDLHRDTLASHLIDSLRDANFNIDGKPVIAYAAEKERPEIVAKLLDDGASADVNVGKMPLIHFVIDKRWLEILKKLPTTLVNKCYETAYERETPLNKAVDLWSDRMSAWLIENGADLDLEYNDLEGNPIDIKTHLENPIGLLPGPMPRSLKALEKRGYQPPKSQTAEQEPGKSETKSPESSHQAAENKLEQYLQKKPRHQLGGDTAELEALIKTGAMCGTYLETAKMLIDGRYINQLVLFINIQPAHDLTDLINYMISKKDLQQSMVELTLRSITPEKLSKTPFSDDKLFVNHGMAEHKSFTAADAIKFIEKLKAQYNQDWADFLILSLCKVSPEVANEIPFTHLFFAIDEVLACKKSHCSADDVNAFSAKVESDNNWGIIRNDAFDNVEDAEIPKVKFVNDEDFILSLIERKRLATIEDIETLIRMDKHLFFWDNSGEITPIDNPSELFDIFDDSVCSEIFYQVENLSKEHFFKAIEKQYKITSQTILQELAEQELITLDELAEMKSKTPNSEWKEDMFQSAFSALKATNYDIKETR